MNKEIQYGYCHCGCGQQTDISNRTYKKIGWEKGKPKKWIKGHHLKASLGENSNNWKGGRHKHNGYIRTINVSSSEIDKRVNEHVLIVERVLGKKLPKNSVVHHINEIKDDNRNENLVICENREYHLLLHMRLNALRACGNVQWKKCWICKIYDKPENLEFNGRNIQHVKCRKEYMNKRYQNRRN